jgi:2-dehydropantoate 2-reductase
VQPVQATDDPAQVGPVDAVLVAVKAWQVPEAAQAMRPLVGPDTFVVPLQNGVEAPAQLAAVLGPEHVLGGLCRIVSLIAGPGHIRHVGLTPSVAFGELSWGETRFLRRAKNLVSKPSRAERLRQAFARAQGLSVEIPADIQAAMWEKFVFIAALSGVGAVTRAPAGALRSVPETRRLLEQAMQEVCAVARARGIALSDDMVARTMAYVDGLSPTATASMQRDIMEGRPSELAAQNGAVVRLGEEVGVATPVHSFIYGSLLPMEVRARGQLEFPG